MKKHIKDGFDAWWNDPEGHPMFTTLLVAVGLLVLFPLYGTPLYSIFLVPFLIVGFFGGRWRELTRKPKTVVGYRNQQRRGKA